jgi:peptide/nickel transport system substrate-binding protein
LTTVVLRFIADPNTMAATILAGEVDVVLPLGMGVSAAREVERRWQGTGNQVRYITADRFEYLRPQLRSEYAEPRNGFAQRAVREALYRAVDRELLANVVADGLAPLSDSWVAPATARRRRVEGAIPQYPHEPARAQALLTDADWIRGPDNVLAHRATGERFDVQLNSTAGSDTELKLSSIADNWKAVGVQPSLYIIPSARAQDAEHRVKLPGVELISHGGEGYPEQFLHTRLLATAANRWGGRNAYGYSNPAVDDLVDRLAITIEPERQTEIERALLQTVMRDVAIMPLFWRVDPYLHRAGVKGMRGSLVLEATWNVFEWDRE